MKKYTFMALLLVGTFVFAQEKTGMERAQEMRGKHMGHHMEGMQKELNLSPEQTSKIQSIHDKYATKEKSSRDNFRTMRDQKHEEIKSVLNEDQKAKFDAMKSRHKHGMKSHCEKMFKGKEMRRKSNSTK